MYLAIAVNHRILWIGAHAAGPHLVGGEHHDAIDAHSVALQLTIKLAKLLLADHAILWPIQTRAFIVQ